MSGTINISRDLWTDPAFAADPFSEREAWVWLIADASWKPRVRRVGNHVVNLNRGEVAHSTRFLAETWGWSHSKVRRYLERLEKLGLIAKKIGAKTDTVTGTKAGTVVTVLSIRKYDKYQAQPQATGTEAAQNRHRTGTNEKKGEIRVKEREPPLPPLGGERAILCEVMSEQVADDFIAHRKAKRAKLTDRAARMIADKLRGHHDPDAVVRLSVMNGWTGVFPEQIGAEQKPPVRIYDLSKFAG